jgi:nucleotide-binding universal stress UspA family protein
MFANVVVAIKEEVPAAPLLELARKAAPVPAKLHLVTLVQLGARVDERQHLADATDALETMAAALRDEGYDATSYVGAIAAAAGSEILGIAEERGADLVVIGLAKRTRVSKALIGSDAQRVLLSARRPVLSAPVHAS